MEHVLLPEPIAAVLQDEAKQKNETAGVLFYEPSERKVVGIYDIGDGDEETVEADPAKDKLAIRIALALQLEKIDYHIHSRGTIGLPGGERWLTEPSDGDLEGIMNGLARNPRYKHLLVSEGYLRPISDNFTIATYEPSIEEVKILKDVADFISEEEIKAGLV